MKKIVVFDIDGVLADFVHGFTSLAGSVSQKTIPVTRTNAQPSWDGFPGLSKSDVDRTWSMIKKDFGFWNGLEAIATEREFTRIDHLSFERDVYFVTSRVGIDAKLQTEMWLLAHRITRPTVIISSNKGEACRILKATHAIDDKAGNAVAIQYMSEAKSYIIDRPYNKFDHTVIGTKVQRVTSVTEFLNEVEAA